jgi:formate hydrogenlyase subunit 3/multisubunit Na+/H+ antiporter MnhD subunit
MNPGFPAMMERPHGGGELLVLCVLLPVAALLATVVAGGRYGRAIALVALAGGIPVVYSVAKSVWQSGEVMVERLGGWAPPLGLMLRADGLSVVMLATTALLVAVVAFYAPASFRVARGQPESRASLVFWVMLSAIWASLNLLFVSNDLFNLYVALELVAFAAIPLVYLEGKPGTVLAGLRYLLFALMGSVLYLLGTALIYGRYGTMDLTLLAGAAKMDWALCLSVGLMTAGLMAKTALFPLHLWLPPAHAGANPAASALLSALVVKGSFFLVLRIWFDLLPALNGTAAAQLVGAMGAAAVVMGGVMAVRQQRLKLLIAYSTVAQIGYLFLIFPLAKGPAVGSALSGGIFLAISHAFAKASMFMTAGLIAETYGHDRIAGLRGVVKSMPVAAAAFLLAAVSLIGVPPTGGFAAKWRLLGASVESGQWWWALVVLTGGLLAGAYMFRAVSSFVSEGNGPAPARPPGAAFRDWLVLALAAMALLVGLFPDAISQLLEIGRAPGGEVVP